MVSNVVAPIYHRLLVCQMLKYSINDNFFEAITTENQAYFLGFLYADGYVNRRKFVLSLQEKDKDILEKFCLALNTQHPLYFTPARKTIINDKEYQCQGQFSLCIYNVKMCKDLHNLGCFQNKSLTLKFPTCVPDHLLNHFIRGYFDGDGWVSEAKGYRRIVGFISSASFIETLNQKFSHLPHSIDKRRQKQGLLALHYRSKKTFDWWYKYLYTDATVYLKRKKDRFEEILAKF
jgi:LAGLIDADG-like domain